MKKTVEYISWLVFAIALILLIANIASSALYILILLGMSIILFIVAAKSANNISTKIGMISSIVFFIIALTLYLFAKSMI